MNRPARRDDRSQLKADLALVVISVLLSAAITLIMPPLIEALGRPLLELVVQAISPFPFLLKTFIVLGSIAVILYVPSMAVYYLYRLTEIPPAREVTVRRTLKFTWVDRLFLYPVFRSSVRIIIGSGLLMTILILVIGAPFLPPILLFCLVLLVVLNTLREFNSRHGAIGEAVEFLIDQLLFALGAQIELTVKEALGTEDYRLRCQIMLLDPQEQRLELKHGYHMAREPDENLPISPTQCIRGFTFTQRRRALSNPYAPEKLGFSKEQCDKLPQISWMAAFPLLLRPEEQSFGVLSVDCNRAVAQEWLDKILDFGQAISIGIAIVYNIRYNVKRPL